MQVTKLLHNFLSKAVPHAHKKRVQALVNATHALLLGKILTLTQLARHMPGSAKERHKVRMIDRLLGNKTLQKEVPDYYSCINDLLLSNRAEPILISVDWSSTDKSKDFHILRASACLKGRGFVVYEEVHKESQLNNNKTHKLFLARMKQVLPENTKVILITDAGFCNPWFKEAIALGYQWLGRTKSTINFKQGHQNEWGAAKTLHKLAKNKAFFITDCTLTKSNKIACNIVVHRGKVQGRINKTRGGTKAKNTYSKRIGRRQREPWILVTSLDSNNYSAKQVVALYKKRMQIEENFRDTKSTRYGFSLRYCMSKSEKRIQVLLMIALLASFACWLAAIGAQSKNLHFDYQANTEKNKTVLSAIYLGCQLIRRGYQITIKEFEYAVKKMQQLIFEAIEC